MQHIIVKSITSSELAQPLKFFIDIECDTEMQEPECKRIEIPRRLAKYIDDLQIENRRLSQENKRLRKDA